MVGAYLSSAADYYGVKLLQRCTKLLGGIELFNDLMTVILEGLEGVLIHSVSYQYAHDILSFIKLLLVVSFELGQEPDQSLDSLLGHCVVDGGT